MDESFSIPEVETPAAENERSELHTQLRTTHEKSDRRKLPQETEQAIVKSLDFGASISETAREHEVSKSVVHQLKKQQEAQPAKATTAEAPKSAKKGATSDPVNEWIAQTWESYGHKTMTSDRFKYFKIDVLEAPATTSVMFHALEAFKFE